MATQTSLLPVYHEPGQDPASKSSSSSELNHMDVDLSSWTNLQDEAFLQELLSGQGDDLLSSLLEPTPAGSTNPSSTSIGAPLTFDFDATLGSAQTNLLPTSPVGSDGCTSDSYSITNGGSPLMNMNGGAPIVAENLGGSPQHQLTESPNHSPSPFMSSALPVTDPSQMAMDPSLDFSDFNGVDLTNFMTSDATISSTSLSLPQAPPTTSTTTSTFTDTVQPSSSTSNDIKIDVEPHSSGMRGSVSSDVSAASPQSSSSHSPSPSSTSSSDRKAATLYLTDEEKRLLAAEGITLPTDMPLTKAEQKQLKRVQRKIKNKISAQESRKRKKDYVGGLEERVKICTERNQELKREVDCLKSENQSLLAQLKKLQTMVLQYNPSRAQAGTVVMVLILSFSLFLVPRMKYFAPGKGIGRGVSLGFSRPSRTLLFTETDDFGNVIDPETGKIISPIGGQSPSPPLPWVYQTPAILFKKLNRTLLSSSTVAGTEEKSSDEGAPSSNDSWLRKSESSEHNVIETTDEL